MAYGFQIRNSSGTLTLDSTTQSSNVIVSGTVASITSSTQSGNYYYGDTGNITCTGMDPGGTDNSDEVGIWIANGPHAASNGNAEKIEVLRDDGQFKLRYHALSNNKTISNVKYYALRY